MDNRNTERDPFGRFINGHAINTGKRHTQETKDKISISKTGKNRGEESHSWKGGVSYNKGRKLVLVSNHHGRKQGSHVCEYRLIVERILGRGLKRSEVVHHINGDTLDNRNKNMMICTNSYHSWLHHEMRRQGIGTLKLGG